MAARPTRTKGWRELERSGHRGSGADAPLRRKNRFGLDLPFPAARRGLRPGRRQRAGKTTLIKHLLGLLRAESGAVRVSASIRWPTRSAFFRGSATFPENDLPGWMRVDELLPRGPSTPPGTTPTPRSCGRRSRSIRRPDQEPFQGAKARAGLLVALAYRPELLVLDEPSSGLDPIVRRDILGAVLRTIADEGRTVLFSSHLLDEVERVADHVTLISAEQNRPSSGAAHRSSRRRTAWQPGVSRPRGRLLRRPPACFAGRARARNGPPSTAALPHPAGGRFGGRGRPRSSPNAKLRSTKFLVAHTGDGRSAAAAEA